MLVSNRIIPHDLRGGPKSPAVNRRLSRDNFQPPAVMAPPRFAVVIGRRKDMRRRWWRAALAARYGIVQTWRIGLRRAQWQAAAVDGDRAMRLRARVKASLFFWPDVIVVLGLEGALDDTDAKAEQCRVRRIVRRLTEWRMPVDVLGLWATESHRSAAQFKELIRTTPEASTGYDGADRNDAAMLQGEPSALETSYSQRSDIMKTTEVLISGVDFERLSDVVESPRYRPNRRVAPGGLREGLGRGTVVAPTEVPADIVTMRSRVRVRDLPTGSVNEYTLVYPDEADFTVGKVSILAPLGSALLGARAESVINVHAPTGVRRMKVERILYQPEAAGHFDL